MALGTLGKRFEVSPSGMDALWALLIARAKKFESRVRRRNLNFDVGSRSALKHTRRINVHPGSTI